MTNSKHVPKRRFSGFDGEWKEIKLYEVVQDFIVPMRDKPKEFSGNIPWTRIDDIEGKYISRSLKGHCVSLETVKRMNLKIIPEDSLIVSASATFGTVAIVKNDLITNQTFIGLVPKNKYEVEFLFYLFQSPKVRNYMKEESAGSTIFYISRESFEKMEINLPDEKERKLISKQLCTIDSLISLHQHKLDKLKDLKKAYLTEMFPAEGERVPKRRFPGFEGEWEEKKLSEVVKEFIVPMRDKPKEFSGNIPWTRIDDIEGKYISRSLMGHCVSLETVKRMNLKVIPEGSLIVSASATFGTVAIVKNDLITNQTFIGLVPKHEHGVEFLYYLFQSPKIRNYMKEESAGSTIFYISKESFEKMEIDLPDEKERKLISKQLRTVDSLITLQQQKLDKLNDLKKAYLNELFV